MKIVITGTPGTGKTSVAKELSKVLKIPLFDVSELLNKSTVGFDRKRNCKEVDEKKFGQLLGKIKGDFILESHLSHNISTKFVTLVIVLVCNKEELKQRLEKKGWKKSKIEENLEAENMRIILGETMDAGHRVIEYDTTGKTARKSAEELKSIILAGDWD